MTRSLVASCSVCVALACAGTAGAAVPKPGQFRGTMDVPYTLTKGSSFEDHDDQPLRFTVGGNRRRMFAFNVPICTSWTTWGSVRSNRVVRPSVSRSGVISGRLRDGKLSVRVTGRFTGRRRAQGTVSVSSPGCRVEGLWTARHV